MAYCYEDFDSEIDEEILEEEERLALRQLGHFTISDLSNAIGM